MIFILPQRLPQGKQFTRRKAQFTTALPSIHERRKRSIHRFGFAVNSRTHGVQFTDSGSARPTANGGNRRKASLA